MEELEEDEDIDRVLDTNRFSGGASSVSTARRLEDREGPGACHNDEDAAVRGL